MQKIAKLKKSVFFSHAHFFLEVGDEHIEKNTCKNLYLGYIFMSEKYMFRVCSESPFKR